MQHDVRQLLTSARDSFHSMHLEWDAEYDMALLHKASGATDAAAMAATTRAVAMIAPPDAATRAAGDEARFRHQWRAWWRRPSQWRDDVVWTNGSVAVSIIDDGSATTYVSAQRTVYRSRPTDSAWVRLQAAFGVRRGPRPAS